MSGLVETMLFGMEASFFLCGYIRVQSERRGFFLRHKTCMEFGVGGRIEGSGIKNKQKKPMKFCKSIK